MNNEYRMLFNRARWLVEHGYMHGDIHKIAEELKLRENIQKRENSDK